MTILVPDVGVRQPGRVTAALEAAPAPTVQAHLARLERRAALDLAGMTPRRQPFGELMRDTRAGREKIAHALARLGEGAG